MLTGSHHYQAFWTRDRGELFQFPFVYHLQEERWIPRRHSFLKGDGERISDTSIWNETCIQCHSVAGAPGYQGNTAKTRVAELGIACEACHAAGSGHIALHRQNEMSSDRTSSKHPDSRTGRYQRA
jgi:hypothetical protein